MVGSRMSEIDLGVTMDALAAKLEDGGVSKRIYAWPVDSVAPPAVVIGYPTALDFDVTFGRGSDRAVFPIYFVAGRISDRTTRDALSVIVTGANSIKTALDGPLSSTLGGTVRVTDCQVQEVTVGSISLLAAVFSTEVVT